jgi:hypothetical protein
MVVPGPSFGEHERPLFDWLVGVGRRAHLRPAEAQRYCFDIESGMARADQPGTFERLAERLVELKALAPQLEGSPARLARALRMLETVFNALSIPAKSLSLPTVGARKPIQRQRSDPTWVEMRSFSWAWTASRATARRYGPRHDGAPRHCNCLDGVCQRHRTDLRGSRSNAWGHWYKRKVSSPETRF